MYQNRYGVWAAYIPKLGQRSLKTCDDAEARERFRALLDGRGAARKAPAEQTEATLSAIADAFLDAPHGWTPRTLDTMEARALAFVKWMDGHGVRYPSKLTDPKVDDWMHDRQQRAARSTANRDLVVARAMLKWATKRKLCEPTPLETRDTIREPRRAQRREILSHADLALVVEEMRRTKQDGAALALRTAALTGLRIDELRHITLADVESDGVWVRPETGTAAEAWTSKGYRERRIPLAAEAADVVRAFVQWRGGKGGKGKRIGLSDTWLAKRIDAARKPVGVAKFRAHDLRRLFATANVDAGIPVRVVSGWLGHAEIATTETYIARQRSDGDLLAVLPTIATAHKERIKSGRR